MDSPEVPELKPYETSLAHGVLTITIRKEFDIGALHQNWAHTIITLHPGPYTGVRLDMTQSGLVSSTFFAGLMQLHFHYNPAGDRPLELVKPDPRALRNLQIMRMDGLFGVDPR